VHTYIGNFVTNFTATDLHEDIFDHGTLVYESPSVQEIQSYAGQQLGLLWDEYKRSLNPAEYPVDLSQACWDNKMKNIEEAKKHTRNAVPV
jgi:nicotinate phosphoribosyltransferase